MKKGIVYILTILTVLALIVFVLQNNKEKNAARVKQIQKTDAFALVNVYKVTATDIYRKFVVNGYFEPVKELLLLSESTGRLLDMKVKEGSQVKVGQVLAVIDNNVLRTNLSAAAANLDNAKKNLTRYEGAYKTGGVSKQQLDQIQVQLHRAESDYTLAKQRFQDSYVKSPISGVVNQKFVEQGAYLRPGDRLFTIVAIDKLKLSVRIPEEQIGYCRIGKQVKVVCNALPGQEFKGKLTFIGVKADAALHYPVDIEVDNRDQQGLRAGMYANAYFNILEKIGIVIPRTAFVGSVHSQQVYVMEKDAARLLQVVPGRIFGDSVEVTHGLSPEMMVITSGQINLKDGAKVVVQSN